MKYALIAVVTLCSGCMSQQQADQIVSQLPQYMQDNIGPVTVTPFRASWLLGATGETEVDKPGCPVFIAPWAVERERTVRHEAMHSFEFSIYEKDVAKGHAESGGEWHRFNKAFGDHKYLGYEFGLAASLVPFALDMPLPGYERAYGAVSHCEDVACVFENKSWVTWDNQELRHKREAVEKFVHGGFADKPATTVQAVAVSDGDEPSQPAGEPQTTTQTAAATADEKPIPQADKAHAATQAVATTAGDKSAQPVPQPR